METADAGFHHPPCHLWVVSGAASSFLRCPGGRWTLGRGTCINKGLCLLVTAFVLVGWSEHFTGIILVNLFNVLEEQVLVRS